MTIIRPATENDLPEIVEVDQEAFGPYGTGEDPAIFQARLTVFPQGFVVAEEAGKIISYGCSEKWAVVREPGLNENPNLTHNPSGKVFCITGMAVRPSHQNRRIGSAILDCLIGIAQHQECSQIILETSHAENFYRHRGFTILGNRIQNGTTLTVVTRDIRNG